MSKQPPTLYVTPYLVTQQVSIKGDLLCIVSDTGNKIEDEKPWVHNIKPENLGEVMYRVNRGILLDKDLPVNASDILSSRRPWRSKGLITVGE